MGIYIAPGTSSDRGPGSAAGRQPAETGNGGNGFGGRVGGDGGTTCDTDDSGLSAPQQIANVSSGTLIIGVICGSPAQSIGLTAGAR